MSLQTGNAIAMHIVLGRESLVRFLEETARFYDSRLAVLDGDQAPIAVWNAGASGFPRSTPAKDSRLSKPIEVYESVVGYVVTDPLSPEDEPAAKALARHVAELISELASKEYELNDLSQEILDSYEEVNLFYEVSAALGTARDVHGVCSVILRKACEIILADRASILLLDEKAGELYVAAAVGITEEERPKIRIPVGEGISGKVLESRTPRLVDDVSHLPRGLLKGYEQYTTRSFVSVPLCVEGGAGEPPPLGVVSLSDGSYAPADRGRAIGVLNMTDKESRANFTSGDLKLLTALASQAAILIENIRLVEFEKELKIARHIQRSLLPESPPPMAGVDVAGNCVPARNVGGDYFDIVVRERTGELALVIADVSGHNLASALMMAVARSALRSEIRTSVDAGTALARFNDFLYEDLTRAELFLSAFFCLFDPETATLRYANAGHNPAILHRRATGSTTILDADGLLAGVIEGMTYAEEEVVLEPGDVVLLYTDGLIEASDGAGRMFGIDSLATSLEESADLPAAEILERIYAEVDSFSGEPVQADDMTAVVLKLTEPPVR